MKAEVSEKAYLMMANPQTCPGLAIRAGMRTLVRFSHDPAFHLSRSWSIHEAKSEFYVRRIVWDQHLSYISEKPVMFGSESSASSSLVAKILNTLHSIRVSPFVPNNSIGIDGEIHGIEFGDYWLSWWCEPPQGWDPLRKWFADAERELDALLPAHVDD